MTDLLDLAQKLARLNPDAGEIGEGMLRNLIEGARDLVGHPDQPIVSVKAPAPEPGRRLVGAFRCPVDADHAAKLMGLFAKAYDDTRLASTTAAGWTWFNALPDREGGAGGTGGEGRKGEAPIFFPAGPTPAAAGAATAAGLVETAAQPSKTTGNPAAFPAPVMHAGRLVRFDGTARRLTFEFSTMPPTCRLGDAWLVQPAAAVPTVQVGQTSFAFSSTAPEPNEIPIGPDRLTDGEIVRFEAWFRDWIQCFANRAQAAAVFGAAQPAGGELTSFDDMVRQRDEAIRERNEAVEDRDRYKTDLDSIGHAIGCDHTDDGLARCVRETLDQWKANFDRTSPAPAAGTFDDLAVEIATFSKTREWPEPGSESFLEFAVLLDRLSTAVSRRFPAIVANWKKARP